MRTPPQKRMQQREIQQSPRSSRQSSLSPGNSRYLTPSKRRKREREQKTAALASNQKIQAESFVMKLFDRSLDLSKYTEHTPLYPICRAWIANQPRNPSINPSYRDQRSPSPIERKGNATEVLSKLRRGESREVHDMPAPKTEVDDLQRIYNAETVSIENLKQLDNLETHELGVAKREELLALHMSKWKQVKSKWLKHTKTLQKRYEINHLIIQELFKP